MELVHLECQREVQGQNICVFISTNPDGDEPWMIASISVVNSSDMYGCHISKVSGPYNLEVSSPGPSSATGLKSATFDRFKGNRVNIRTTPI